MLESDQSRPPQPANDEEVVDQYRALRNLARTLVLAERTGQSLAATDLAHEAWLQLAGNKGLRDLSPDEFRRHAALVMRHLLIDRARARATHKRGGRRLRLPLDALELAATGDYGELLAVDEAIEKLAARDPGLGELVRLRFFAGLSVDETAIALGQSSRTVNRDWIFAKALLVELLKGEH